MGVTFSRETWEQAEVAWAAGEFSPAWGPWRRIAASRGILYPPTGTRWDDVDDEHPSQRAQLWRAIEDTPTALRKALVAASSWHDVVRTLNGERDARRAGIDDGHDDDREGPSPVQSGVIHAGILEALLNQAYAAMAEAGHIVTAAGYCPRCKGECAGDES